MYILFIEEVLGALLICGIGGLWPCCGSGGGDRKPALPPLPTRLTGGCVLPTAETGVPRPGGMFAVDKLLTGDKIPLLELFPPKVGVIGGAIGCGSRNALDIS